MTKRIFSGAFFVSLIAVITAVAIVLGAVYSKNIEIFTMQIEDEARILAMSMNDKTVGESREHLRGYEGFSSRITLVSDDGKVLFDNKADPDEMENHANREEIIAAKKSGEGTATRTSSTLSERTIYCAAVLQNGCVVRVSGTQDTALGMILDMWWGVLLALLLAVILSALLADLIANRIVKPINNIDLKNPDIDENYGEIAPLLHRIREQNNEIEIQMSALRKSREEFSLIAENMSEGFIMINQNGEILSNNSAVLKIFGTELKGGSQNILTLNRSENFRSAVNSALGGQNCEVNLTLDNRVYQMFANPVFADEKISGAVIIILDVTEKEKREQLRREFTSNVSHELKTPLTTIFGVADMLANGIVKPNDVGEFGESIRSEAARLITLIEDIIKLSRLDENSLAERESVNVYELAGLAVKRLSAKAEKNSVEVNIQGESAYIFGIPSVIEEIIYNLLDNAIKYNKPNGTAEIAVSQTENIVKVTCSDTGIGIPAESINRVFERFYRVDKSRSHEIGGTGLGLSIVKHGVALHNGFIDLESVEGGGTTVSVSFPNNNIKSDEEVLL